MRLMTLIAFVAGYAFAHYGILEGQWSSLSPQTQLFVSTLAIVMVIAWWFDKHVVTHMVES